MPKPTSRIRAHVFKRDGYRCRRCGSNKGLTLDHIVPKAAGGTNAIRNLQTLCEDCNTAKADDMGPRERAALRAVSRRRWV